MKKIYVTTGFLAALLLSSLTSFAQSQSREDLLKEIETKRKELVALEKNFLSPTEDDRAKYADFLRAPNTGLIRLLPREKYGTAASLYNNDAQAATTESFTRKSQVDLPQAQQSSLPNTSTTNVGPPNPSEQPGHIDVPRLSSQTARVKGSLMVRGGGAYYSFTQKTHEYGYGSDIELSQGDLMSGFAGADYGLMALLGDVPLENIGLELPEVNVLAAYKAAAHEPHARVEQRRFGQGTEILGLKVKDRLPLRVDSTYLLRSVNYGSSDVLVAFRVIRVDSDGSAIILWKLLKQYPIPQLAQNTN